MEHRLFVCLQTGQQITTRTEGGMQYAELPLGPGADPGQAVSQVRRALPFHTVGRFRV